MAAKFSLGSIQLLNWRQQLWRVQRHLSKRFLVLEFTPDFLVVAQFQVRPSGLKLCGFAREPLPNAAVERGVPADPPLMAELIGSLCKEQLLVAHRAMVVLPPEAVHCSSHWLFADLDKPQLQQMLLEPAPPVQLPFPLSQTDFDVVPHGAFGSSGSEDKKLWTILAVANRLCDGVLKCLQLADQECTHLELSLLCLSRLAQSHLASLSAGQSAVILDFDRNQTHVVVSTSDGPLLADRLTAIRSYPHGEHDAQENYLPLSEIDLQAFVDDFNHLVEDLQQDVNLPQTVSKIVVAGINSAHPNLIELLTGMLQLPVVGINIFENSAVDGLDQLALTESCFFHRIMGAAMALVTDLPVGSVLTETIFDAEEISSSKQAPVDAIEISSLNRAPSQQAEANNQALEAAMYSDIEPSIADGVEPFDLQSSLPLPEPDTHQQQEKIELSTSSSKSLDVFSAGPESSPLFTTDSARGDSPVVSQETIATDDPSTWPSVGKRRLRTPRTEPSSTSNAEPATPWQAPPTSEPPDTTDSDDSSLFSFGSTQASLSAPNSASSDQPLISDSERAADALSEDGKAGTGLFSFASGTDSSPQTARKDLIDESQSDSDYSLGLGEP